MDARDIKDPSLRRLSNDLPELVLLCEGVGA